MSLTAVLNMPFTQSFWEGCPAWNDTRELTVNQPQKVSVTWGRKSDQARESSQRHLHDGKSGK